MASPVLNHSSYDVFLNFRGKDTRFAFTDHLHKALKDAGIYPFMDNDDINTGEGLEPKIESAIKESRGSIVVLSENYATSPWCLDELHLILEQRRECGHFVLPIFYHVDPSDVDEHKNNFAIHVRSSKPWTLYNVNRWKAALREVTTLKGEVVLGPEAEIVKKIVDELYEKLECKPVKLPPNLTGIDTRYEDIKSWLEELDAQFLSIFGMEGIGKTTLANYILDRNWHKFENICFLEDIGGRCKEPHDLVELQKQLLQDISGGKKRKIPGVPQGTCKIEEALERKKSLIVLDAIDSKSQLEALLGNGTINPQSKIIITTTVVNTEGWFWPSVCRKYEMSLLTRDESSELLSRHAFRSKAPMQGFEQLAEKALQCYEGHPLALELLGSDLFVSTENLEKRESIPIWESKLKLLETDLDSRIHDILKSSYESLPYFFNKELFLDIACFFVGIDMDYVIKILDPDYSALSEIKTLIDRSLLFVSPNNKLMMHRLLQKMGRRIVEQSHKDPAKRSRVWCDKESYDLLKKGKGSRTMEGLALDMKMLSLGSHAFKSTGLKTDSLTKMDGLRLLQFKHVPLIGSYDNFSEHLRWLCWHGFDLTTIPSDLFMGNVVAIDMSYSKLKVFEPPMDLKTLKVLNLKDSRDLSEIRSIYRLPNLETLVLWNCINLTHVCETIGSLGNLVLLHMTGCESVCRRLLVGLRASTAGGSTERTIVSLPQSLERLFLKDCKLECTDNLTLGFGFQLSLQYLNLANSLFESLPNYNHLKNLRVLDLSFCSRLKRLLCLPSTLAELYTYHCESLEKITFESQQFTLQEFGYEGCINLLEVQGFIKLVPIAKLDETELGHMMWLKEYQNHEVCLAGDDQLTKGRSMHIQMLYEFNIMSTSLPDINDPNMTPEYISEFHSLSFDVPLCPKNRRLKGLDVSFKYTISGENPVWFAKINVSTGVDFMYYPRVFGKPKFGEVAIWFSYWPIGNILNVGDDVNVSIAVISGLEVCKCGASLVYYDDEVAKEALENKMGWVEILGGDLSAFQLPTGAYHLCHHNLFELMEVGRLTSRWFSTLVGDSIDCTAVRGWGETGRPKQLNRSFIELKTVRCIIDGPESEQIYAIGQTTTKPAISDAVTEETTNVPLDRISMASGSSSSILAYSVTNPITYGVLGSFRGEESGHLHDQEGSYSVIDDDDMDSSE